MIIQLEKCNFFANLSGLPAICTKDTLIRANLFYPQIMLMDADGYEESANRRLSTQIFNRFFASISEISGLNFHANWWIENARITTGAVHPRSSGDNYQAGVACPRSSCA
jgi:hypothetical protein